VEPVVVILCHAKQLHGGGVDLDHLLKGWHLCSLFLNQQGYTCRRRSALRPFGKLRVLGNKVLSHLCVPGWFCARPGAKPPKHQIVIKCRTYAVGVLAGARGPQAPENLLFLPTCGGKAATGG